jgi:gas vesicle protein
MFDDHDSGSWPLLAFVLGGLTGLSLAVLFAPESGADTRERVSHGARTAGARVASRVRRTGR